MARRQTTGTGLSADEAFTGLVDHGLFSEKLPPCFTSAGLSHHRSTFQHLETEENPKRLWKFLSDANHDYIRHRTLRDTNVPRLMGIPHPESHLAQCLAIKRYWSEIKRHCAKPDRPVSRIFVRKTTGNRVFRMNYRGPERYKTDECEMLMMTGAAYVVHADIASCFPSIYTHSVPWAMHGHGRAKKRRRGITAGNVLDRASQSTRDGQTNGLLIGPHASNVLAEVVLTQVDHKLLNQGYTNLVRHIDDYRFYATDHAEAESFLRHLALELGKFDLALNDRKTTIRQMPQPLAEDWMRELKSLRLASSNRRRIKIGATSALLDLALKLARDADTYRVLNYALKMVPPRLGPTARRVFVRQGVNLALQFPYLAWILDEHLFEKHRYDGIDEVVEEFSSHLLSIASKDLYPDAACHALHLALKYRKTLTTLDEDAVKALVEMDDCLATVLLLRYLSRHPVGKLRERVARRANKLKDLSPQDQDRSWLLIYEIWQEGTLRDQGQRLLADLKRGRFRFVVF